MLVKQRFYRKSNFWRQAVIYLLVLLAVIGFWNDVVIVFLRLLWAMVLALFGGQPDWKQVGDVRQGIENFIKFMLLFLVFLPISLVTISQFVLPVYTFRERLLVAERLVRYFFGRHGPAIFVREGKEIASPEEMLRAKPGVAFVDMKSGILLQKISKENISVNRLAATLNRIFKRPLPPKAIQIPQMVRAEGPGIVFFGANEKIQGVADLRRQFRINLGAEKDGIPEGVKAITADGIEVISYIITIFTIGQPADVLKVAYVDDGKPDDPTWTEEQRRKAHARKWRVIKFYDKKQRIEVITANGRKENLWVDKIERISEDDDTLDLDPQDKEEILRFASARQKLHGLIDELGKNERIIQDFIIWLAPNLNTPMRAFVAQLWENQATILHRWINGLVPVETDNLYRFVINKSTFHQLVDNFALYGKPTLHRFINLLFGSYRQRISQYYVSLPPDLRRQIKEVFDIFYLDRKLSQPTSKPVKKSWTPYEFNARRVFAALYAKAVNPAANDQVDWTELPTQVATDFFREHISQYKYDEIYNPDSPTDFPLTKIIKPKFMKKVKYQGVMAYQIICPKENRPPVKDDIVTSATYDLEIPAIELRSPKVLRERGIKVLVGTFSELKVSETIRQQRLDNWQARWQADDEIFKAEEEQKTLLLRNQARVDAFSKMTYSLSQIFQTPYSQEAMAVRLFQALESAVADPATRQLLPHDTIELLRSLRFWLLQPEGSPPQDVTPRYTETEEGSETGGTPPTI